MPCAAQEYRAAWGVSPRAVLLCGDCNGSHRGRVGSYLRSQARAAGCDRVSFKVYVRVRFCTLLFDWKAWSSLAVTACALWAGLHEGPVLGAVCPQCKPIIFYANDYYYDHTHCVQFLMYITPYTLFINPIPDMLLPRGRVFAARTTSAAAAKPGCRTQTTREYLPQWTTSGEATLHANYAVSLVRLEAD